MYVHTYLGNGDKDEPESQREPIGDSGCSQCTVCLGVAIRQGEGIMDWSRFGQLPL